MPYSAEHKLKTRAQIVEAARVLFNRHGFKAVSIDMVMESVGLTRGGFYNHFASKEVLYHEAVASFLMGRGAQWRSEAGVNSDLAEPLNATKQMVRSYLSKEHLSDIDGQCPMIALPSDVAREGADVHDAYQQLLEAMVGLFERDLGEHTNEARTLALAKAALCIGGMVVARSLPDSNLAEEVRQAALTTVEHLGANASPV